MRSLGRPEPGLLEAALEGVDAKRAMDRALVQSPDKLVEQAFAVCLEAHAAWQRCSAPQRGQLLREIEQTTALVIELPIEPAERVVLAIAVVVALLSAAPFIAV